MKNKPFYRLSFGSVNEHYWRRGYAVSVAWKFWKIYILRYVQERTLEDILKHPRPMTAVEVTPEVREIFKNPPMSAVGNIPHGYEGIDD